MKLTTTQKTDEISYMPVEGWDNVTHYSQYESEICTILNERLTGIRVNYNHTRYFKFHLSHTSTDGSVFDLEQFERAAKELHNLCEEYALVLTTNEE